MKAPRLDVYRAKDGWRWRLVAANGRIVAESGEAYAKKGNAERAVGNLLTVLVEALG